MNQTEIEKLIEYYGAIFSSISHGGACRPSKEDLIKYTARLQELVVSLPEPVT